MSNQETLRVQPEDRGQRLDQFLAAAFPDESRSYFTRLISDGYVLVNEAQVKAGYKIESGDRIEITFHKPQPDLQARELPLDILFEDEHLIVLNKPAGLTVHPGHGRETDTLVHGLLFHSHELAETGQETRPGIVHRLDKFTSGLLVVAKTDLAMRTLRQQFDSKDIYRIYHALVWGKMEQTESTVRTFINRSRRDPTRMAVSSKGREAVTHFHVLSHFEYFSLLELKLETGRTHQIRVHMQHIHHPVVGDPEYGGRETQLARLPSNLRRRGENLLKLLPHQALHATQLSFLHPLSGLRQTFQCDYPENLADAIRKIPALFLL